MCTMYRIPPPKTNKQTKFDHQLLPKFHNNRICLWKIIRKLLAVQQHQRLPSCCARKNLNSRRWWWRWIRINRRKTSEPIYSISRVFFFLENPFSLFVVFFVLFSYPHLLVSYKTWSTTTSSFSYVFHPPHPPNGTHKTCCHIVWTLKFRI